MATSTNSSRKRTQRDYTLAFKLGIVERVEKGEMTYKQAQKRFGIQGKTTVLVWLRKHGRLDWSKPFQHPLMPHSKETPAQTIKRLERELAEEKLRNQILNGMVDIMDNEYGAGLRKKLLIRYVWQAKAKSEINLAAACRAVGISRQGVYQAVARMNSRRTELSVIKDSVQYWRKYMPRLGTRKLYTLIKPMLIEQDIKLGRDGFFTYLRNEGLLVKPKRSYTKTTFSKHWMKKHPNLLKADGLHDAEHVLVSDITYLESDQGVHYLSLVTDAVSRKIVGHHLSTDMKADSVVKALKMAVRDKRYIANAVHHSDRGAQYCAAVYQDELIANHIQPSMTDGYDCYQNALAERVNGILKQEFFLYRCKTLEELKILVRESIAIYNEMRPHLSLDMATPNQVHNRKGQLRELA
ncbi:IS3 family transposase [Shewanella yunxiaonensis]|uniref:IS3 family transposase n=1 Tax=Shewanella yunxiaonensis TaxID=2829809 RepID=A0ABX7YS67_9GAMM|nr:IS3 family transposase [Shewanella yunxiaonensis]QUN05527.1 IS3 family transposase [Shewanella yunxiaonensis]QUN05625.1 IS3 family transposase [Shewanella yunxiaonensis]QUN06632.1 IS3 family transposase [Shewanella yunxiaonensis]QUN06672.1 IS3 family transposase [Shewanella yunxiaonensis]